MQITCPNCATRYVIDAVKIGRAGRKVKCARCGHQWSAEADPQALANAQAAARVAAPAAEPAAAPAREPEPQPAQPEPAAAPAEPVPEAETPRARVTPEASLHPREEVARARVNLPAPTTIVPDRERRQIVWWAMVALLLGGIIATALTARNTVVAAWPPAVQLYDALGLPVDRALLGDYGNPLAQFDFGALETRIVPRSGREYLIVMGTITNQAEIELTVPPLRLVLKDSEDRTVGDYQFLAEAERLPAGATSRFETEIVDWDPAAASVEVTPLGLDP